MLTEMNNSKPRGPARSSVMALCAAVCRGAARLIPFPIPRTTAGRRLLTVVTISAALLVPALCAMTGSVIPLVVMAPVLSMLVIALGLSVDMITDRPTSLLDERERRVRDSALGRPLEIGIGAGVVIGLLAPWALAEDDPAGMALLMSTAMLAFSLRLIAIAWSLPDAVGED